MSRVGSRADSKPSFKKKRCKRRKPTVSMAILSSRLVRSLLASLGGGEMILKTMRLHVHLS